MFNHSIAVFDLGSQYAHLIARTIRQLGIDSYVVTDTMDPDIRSRTCGIILSGGPNSVYDEGSPTVNSSIFKKGRPILGICYGHQLLTQTFGGKVSLGKVREYGTAPLTIRSNDTLFLGIKSPQRVWMSHGDTASELPKGFTVLASTPDCEYAAIANFKKKIFGVQFHPEVYHTTCGQKLLHNFVFKICKCKPRHDLTSQISLIKDNIKAFTGNKRIFFLVSGGVDSSVAFTLCTQALGKERVHGLCIDTGLMRKNELEEARKSYASIGLTNIDYLDRSEFFLNALKGVQDPEEKRQIIGQKFIELQNLYMKVHKIAEDDWILGQGTIYPDTIESGGTIHSSRIKTHHNRVGAVERLKESGKLLEPIAQYYKDEVRVLAQKLHLPSDIAEKRPFPGPGLAIRCINASHASSRLEDFKEIDNLYRKRSFNAKMLPLRSVGVQGDNRSYNLVLVLEGKISFGGLETISTSITNRFAKVNRVTYLLRSNGGKLENAHIVKCGISKNRLDLLREADYISNQFVKKDKVIKKIWQFPVILIPMRFIKGETIVLRPVSSRDGMTAQFTKMPEELMYQLTEKLLAIPGIDAVLYDITNKPPATIEWE